MTEPLTDRILGMRMAVSPWAPPDTVLLLGPDTYERLKDEFNRGLLPMASVFGDLTDTAFKVTGAILGFKAAYAGDAKAARQATWGEFWHRDRVGTAWWDR